jgi:hypothetical protein
MDAISNKMTFLIKEYEKLKDEQRERISFRDQLIFITLGSVGGVFSFVIEKPDYIMALLVLPFVCIVLGWTYLMNDEKITEMGDYIHHILIPKANSLAVDSKLTLQPSWEEFHRNTKRRKERKSIQLVMDLGIFCISGFFSLVCFFMLCDHYSCLHMIIAVCESLLLIYLAYQFISYTRLRSN